MSGPVPYLSPAQLRDALAIRDLSDPRQGPHAIQLLAGRAAGALSRAWSARPPGRRPRRRPLGGGLRSADPRIAGQMRDLARYRRVSSMPPVVRDLSVAVAGDEDAETLGDRVRDALGADASCVEEVRVLAATAWDQLPAAAVRRLGARPGQRNLLVRVVLRDLETTLTNEAANALRDRIYLATHQGTGYQWAHRAAPRGRAPG